MNSNLWIEYELKLYILKYWKCPNISFKIYKITFIIKKDEELSMIFNFKWKSEFENLNSL